MRPAPDGWAPVSVATVQSGRCCSATTRSATSAVTATCRRLVAGRRRRGRRDAEHECAVLPLRNSDRSAAERAVYAERRSQRSGCSVVTRVRRRNNALSHSLTVGCGSTLGGWRHLVKTRCGPGRARCSRWTRTRTSRARSSTCCGRLGRPATTPRWRWWTRRASSRSGRGVLALPATDRPG